MIPPQFIIPFCCLVALSSALPWNDQPYNANDGSTNTDCQSSGGYPSKPNNIPSCSQVFGAVLPSVQDTKSSSLSHGFEYIISQKGARGANIGVSSSPGSRSSDIDSLGPSFLADHSVHLESLGLGDDPTGASHPQISSSSGEPLHKQVSSETLTDEKESFEDHIKDGTRNIDHKADNMDPHYGAHGDNLGYGADDHGNLADNNKNNGHYDHDYDNTITNDKGKSGLQSDLSRHKFRRWDDVTISESPVAAPKPSKVPPGHTHHVGVDDDEGEE